MILGLDISTSITGFCILDGEGEIIRSGVWDTRNKNKFETFFDKVQHVKDGLQEIKAQYPIQKVFIEKPFMFFGSGGSTAKTMAALQKFNGTISWICYETFEHQPTYFTAQQARKLNEIKVEKGKDTKKQILQWVLDNCPDFSVEYTHKGNPRPKYFDIADAIVVAKAGLKMNWTTGAGKSINFFDITQKIKSHNKNKGQVIVGTDSHIKMGKCTFTTTIVLIGAQNQKGGLYFYKIEKYNDPDRFYNRILKEAEKSINMAMKITELCPSTNVEIHIDISPEECNNRTSPMAKMLVGYAVGSGFACKIKPDSFAASVVADKHS